MITCFRTKLKNNLFEFVDKKIIKRRSIGVEKALKIDGDFKVIMKNSI